MQLKWLVRSTSATASLCLRVLAFEDADLGDNQLSMLMSTYETGAWLFAAEMNVAEHDDGDWRYDDLSH